MTATPSVDVKPLTMSAVMSTRIRDDQHWLSN
jgi:hypothetical protein